MRSSPEVPRPEAKGRRLRGLLAATIAAMALAIGLAMAPGAGAVAFHSAGSFSDPTLPNPSGAAVDSASGNVYVSSIVLPADSNSVIHRFDADGNSLTPATMGNESYYTGLAVEQGGSHTVYALDGGVGGIFSTPQIEAFTSAGAAVGSPFPFDVDPSGFTSGGQLASDASGSIYFPDATTNTVKKYTSAAAAGTPAEFACTGTDCSSTAMSEPNSVAVDSAGNVYVADFGNHRVIKFDSAGAFQSVFYEAENPVSVAVDTATDMVLVAELNSQGENFHVTALDSAGNAVAEIPATAFPVPPSPSQIAVNSTSGRLYVPVRSGSIDATQNGVYMFDILPGPTASTEPASGVGGTTATLNGTVNPQGVVSESCEFQYTTDADFQANEWANAASEPCSPQPFNESTDVAVSADLSGLSPQTTFDYRVVETTEGGTAEGSAVQFTTAAAPPVATTEAASGVSQSAATLHGKVDAEGEDAECEFQYGTTSAYGKSAPCSVNPVSGSSPTAVSAAISGLSAGTTYHFRVIAENGGGLGEGADMTLTTPADTCQTNAALCPPPPVLDTDKDGVADSSDQCVSVPGPASNNGCPVSEPPRNEAAYKVCAKKANKAYKKAKAKAHSAAAKKAAKQKKAKAIRKCAARYL